MRLAVFALAVALPSIAAAATPAGNAAKGEALFKQRCGVCHSTAIDATPRPAPSLKGLLGRKAGSVAGFSYSPALKSSGRTWDRDTLDKFLTAPATFVPGTFMAISVPIATERQDLLTYLASVK